MQTESKRSIENFKRFGDRTSSLISLYKHFDSYQTENFEGEIRFREKKNVVGVACEPFTYSEKKAEFILKLINEVKYANHDKLVFPISEVLAHRLQEAGMKTWQVGVEPIFHLDTYFKSSIDPLYTVPIAKNLKRRGAQVHELQLSELEEQQSEIEELKEEWLGSKKMAPMEFLNVVDPMEQGEYKRYFILRDKNQMMALLTASPIYLNHQIIGFYFNDILKKKNARSASLELLIIESMRKLHTEGVIEVRLGMCPLAEIKPDAPDALILTKIFNDWKIGYNFKNLYQFKNKLHPTQMRPLFLASSNPNFYKTMWHVLKLHFDDGFVKNFITRYWNQHKKNLKLKEHVEICRIKAVDKTKSVASRTKFTISFFAIFVGLHLAKIAEPKVQSFFDQAAYIPGEVTWKGIIFGPFFHNHAFHLIGDQLSFVIFAGALEYVFGATFMLFVMAAGLWLSNPLAQIVLASTLKMFSAEAWQKVLVEKDYGSSNAVFALVGAAAYALKKNGWLLVPFYFHAMFVCYQRESFLAIHHFIGIYLGYFAAYYYFRKGQA